MSPIISEKQEEKLNKFIFHYRIYPVLALVILFFIVINIFLQLSRYSVYAASEYSLPYPGILPNHALYPLKSARDRVLELFTRDPGKKAELYLLYADKRINMAQMLADRSEWELSEATASRAEKYLLKLKEAVEEARARGSAVDVSLLNKTTQASLKHRKVLSQLQRKAPKNLRAGYATSVTLNGEFGRWARSAK